MRDAEGNRTSEQGDVAKLGPNSTSFSKGAKKFESGIMPSSPSGANRGRDIVLAFFYGMEIQGFSSEDGSSPTGSTRLSGKDCSKVSLSICVRSRECRRSASFRRFSMDQNSSLKLDKRESWEGEGSKVLEEGRSSVVIVQVSLLHAADSVVRVTLLLCCLN